MKTLARLLMVGALAGTVVACGDEEGTGPSPTPSIAGNWQASRFELSMESDPSVVFDFLAVGAIVHMQLDASGGFTLTMTADGMDDVVETGTWSLSGNTLTLSSGGEFSRFILSSDRSKLTMVEEHSSFDFDNCGEDEDAHLNATFIRD